MTIPTGLPLTPRWGCGHVRVFGARRQDIDCRTCWLEEFAATRPMSATAERAPWRGREGEANAVPFSITVAEWRAVYGFGAPYPDAVVLDEATHSFSIEVQRDVPQSTNIEREIRAHRRASAPRHEVRTGFVVSVGHTVPPILRPAYDAEGRPVREAMSGHGVTIAKNGVPLARLVSVSGAVVRGQWMLNMQRGDTVDAMGVGPLTIARPGMYQVVVDFPGSIMVQQLTDAEEGGAAVAPVSFFAAPLP